MSYVTCYKCGKETEEKDFFGNKNDKCSWCDEILEKFTDFEDFMDKKFPQFNEIRDYHERMRVEIMKNPISKIEDNLPGIWIKDRVLWDDQPTEGLNEISKIFKKNYELSKDKITTDDYDDEITVENWYDSEGKKIKKLRILYELNDRRKNEDKGIDFDFDNNIDLSIVNDYVFIKLNINPFVLFSGSFNDEKYKFGEKIIYNSNGFNRVFNDIGKQEFYKSNGKLNGEFKQFNQNDIVINYNEILKEKQPGNIIRSGKEIIRYNNGSIKSILFFINELRNGFGISYDENQCIDQIEYYKNDIDISCNSEKNKRFILREIKRYLNDGVKVYPVLYLSLCESLKIDTNKFKDDPNFKI